MKHLITRYFLLLLLLALGQCPALAQSDPDRTTTTKIADLLALLPAQNQERHHDAMQQMDQFSMADLEALLGAMETVESSANSRIAYAVNSYSMYVGNRDHSGQKQKFNEAIIHSIEKSNDPVTVNFMLGLLRLTADESTVPGLSSYLNNPAYVSQTAQVLGTIGGETAGSLLLRTLQQATDTFMIIELINALGQLRHAPAEAVIIAQTGNDQAVNRAAYAALAHIGALNSRQVLQQASKSRGYDYSPDGATANYLEYARNRAARGDLKTAGQIGKEVLAIKSLPAQLKANALDLVVTSNDSKAIGNLLTAAKSEEPAYREAALDMLAPQIDEKTTAKLMRNLKKSSAEIQISLLRFVGRHRLTTASGVVREALDHQNDQVKATAAQAFYQLSGDDSLPLLLSMIHPDYPGTSETVKEILATSDYPGLGDLVINTLADSREKSIQLALLNTVNRRHIRQSAPQVFYLLHHTTDEEIKHTAFRALPQVVSPTDLTGLISLVTTTDDHNLPALLEAITNSVKQSEDPEQQTKILVDAMKQDKSGNGQALYFRALSAIANISALEAVQYALDRPDSRIAAVGSIASWASPDAIPALVELSKSEDLPASRQSEVIVGLIRLIGQSQLPSEQQVLLLRDLFERSSDRDHKTRILRALEATNTFNALLFAGRHLDNKELSSAAANTVMGIALNNPQFNGNLIAGLLEKVSTILSGSESSYLREAIRKHVDALPRGAGFVSVFNGQDLDGWKGLVANPIKRAAMTAETLSKEQLKADDIMRNGWYAEGGELHFNGKGDNIVTTRKYGDFEMYVDWKLAADGKDGDAGIYLRGSPQVQIWDISRVDVGAQVGSGGLYNNQQHPSKPLLVADNPLGEWNTFYIRMVDDRVTVYLNGHLVTDNVVLENYWDRKQPIFPFEQIELQAHGTHVSYRDIFIKELPRKEIYEMSQQEKEEGYTVLFDGTSLEHWTGNTDDYVISDENTLAVYPKDGSGGNLYTKEQFGDFSFRFSFRLTPGANNGVGIRTPMEGDAAYVGMEIQVLDDGADIYKNLADWQYHGSVYGIIAARRGHLKPMGEWNEEEIYIKGNHIRVTLNGEIIVDGDLEEATRNGTLDNKTHPGLQNTSGHIGFLGHGSEVHFKNIRIKRL